MMVSETALDIPSVKTFLKIAQAHDLVVRVEVTDGRTEEEFYLSKSKTHSIGDVKKPARDIQCVFITATNQLDFAVTAAWYDRKLNNALVGGQRSGYHQPRYYDQITKITGEITRCLS